MRKIGLLLLLFYGVAFSQTPLTIADATAPKNTVSSCPVPSGFSVLDVGMHTAQLGWQQDANVSGWEIEIVLQNQTPTGAFVTTNDNQYTAENLIQNRCYDCYLRAVCTDGNSATAGPFHFCTAADYCGGDHFYDTGGPSGNYENFEFKTTVISPAISGDRVRAVFNFFDIKNEDEFKVYNGTDITAPLLYSSENNPNPPGTIAATSASGALAVLFISDGFQTDDGWDASIFCETLPHCAAFPSNIHAETLTPNSATITWDNANAVSWEIEIVPESTSATGSGFVTGINSHVFSNLSPASCYDIYLRTICADGISPWSGVLDFFTTPDYCNGDHFYDSGGAGGNYHNEEFTTSVIYPDQPGNRVKAVFNSFNIEQCCDRLKIYNGSDSTAPLLYNSFFSGQPDTFVSTAISGALTFVFISNDHSTQSGWDATISCEAMPDCAISPSAIHVTESNATSARIAWTDNAAATSWETAFVVHDEPAPTSGQIVDANSVVFSSLIPDTCYDFYVRSICGDANSPWTQPYRFCTDADFCTGSHFYDSGGPGGNYANGEQRTTIIFPTTADAKVSAEFLSFDLESCCDHLKIYDGSDTTAPLIFASGASAPGTITASGLNGALTFEFVSDSNTTDDGWDAVINCAVLSKADAKDFTFLEYYPNPVSQMLHLNSRDKISQYAIYTIEGKLLNQLSIGAKQFDIDMETFRPGSYFIKLINDSATRTIKIIKQ